MARLTFLFPALLALSITPAVADEALENCLIDTLPYWQIEPADGDSYRAYRLAPEPSWTREPPLTVGTAVCDTNIIEASPVRLSTVAGQSYLPDAPETWIVRFGPWVPDLQTFVADLGLGVLAMAQDTLAPNIASVGLTAPKGLRGLEICDMVDFERVAARLQSGGGAPGFAITEFSIENLSSDPEHRQMLETLNPPLAACTVTFVVRTDGTE